MEPCFLPQQSLTSLCALLANLTGGSQGKTSHGAEVYETPASVFYSRYMLTGLPAKAVKEQLAEIVQNAGPLPSMVAYTEEYASNEAPTLLQQAGFVPMARQAGMIFRMENHRPGEARPGAENVSVMTPAEIEEWSATVTEAFKKPDETAAFTALAQSNECLFYGYRENGRLVSTALLHLSSENAGIHEVGTLQSHRRKGLSRLLMLAALDEVLLRGIPLVSLQASPLGKKVYASMGFERVSTLETWMLPPNS